MIRINRNSRIIRSIAAQVRPALAGALLLTTLPAMAAEPPAGSGSYQDLISLTAEFFSWKGTGDDPLKRSAAQAATRLGELSSLQQRLSDMNAAAWNRSQQAEFLALRGAMDQHEFMLRVSRPWERDPGYYVDRMQRLTFVDLPAEGDALSRLREGLRSTVALVENAKKNLRDVPTDFAALAIHNLTQPDGVGHGHPYRAVPPAGVIGWYDDLLGRARQSQPELVEEIAAATDAVRELHAWLLEHQAEMTAQAGVGEELLDWYLMHVKFMPYSSDDIEALAERELERTWAFYALEQHRNRDLPELTLPESREEYEARIRQVDIEIRNFIDREAFMTLPDYIPDDFREVGFNVPWIERPGGPNYWEQIQYRDPSPDHWHADIPGHKVDGRMLRTIDHPIRKYFRDGGRIEGWALYLEETPLQLGFYEHRPRTRELIYNFGIFRAARTLGDVRLQRNEVSIPEVIKFWRSKTPWLDANVARVDAEIYLRRPPGYGLGYTMGSFQMYKLLADRKQQLRDDFVLRDFHDSVMAAGGLPVALIRYELTGLEDEVEQFWDHTSLTAKLEEIGLVSGALAGP
ncbi:MAG: DUF885 family protein [Halieaceae bacterium]|jgi:hypothetical protein|nr:DUF885 family protein [Halieaceae bacterium]